MEFEKKTLLLKNGKAAVFRSPGVADAAEMAGYLKRLAEETEFTSSIPSECERTEEEEIAYLIDLTASEAEIMIICEVDGAVAGAIFAKRMTKWKSSHRAEIGIGIYREYWGLGIGSIFFQLILSWAEQEKIEQLELETLESNERGIHLYRKMGFRETGRIPAASRMMDGTKEDLIIMVREIPAGNDRS